MAPGIPDRRAGVLVPLFSMPSARSWGIGEIGDLEWMTGWLAAAGQRVVQLLPITETPSGDPSPYGALSAMAIDPQFITLEDVEDFFAAGGEAALSREDQDALDGARTASTIDYRTVRPLKLAALRRAFDRFVAAEWAGDSKRASAFRLFRSEHAWWLDDYALFRALHARFDEQPWTAWPDAIRTRQPRALEEQRRALEREILFRSYLQWIAAEQWSAARARSRGVAFFGDLPFVVSGDSADVWSRQDEFGEGSVGVPPDAFSASGQDWGLPPYLWDRVKETEFEWLRLRARRSAQLFDGCRVDHVVGFYRTYVRRHDEAEGEFMPPDEPSQLQLGEQIMGVLRSAGIEIVAEDLGTVPDFVRESLAMLAIPGYKVFRWERHWHEPGQPFKDPPEYPPVAVATSGTHDTEPLAVWWANAPSDERRAVLETPSIRARLGEAGLSRAAASVTLSPEMRSALLEVLFASGADLVILPIQDAFGWSERINQPGTVGQQNWSWRLPWPVDRLANEPEALVVAEQLRRWSRAYHR